MRSTHFIKRITNTGNPLDRFLSLKSWSLETWMSGPIGINRTRSNNRKNWPMRIHGLKVGRFSLQDFDIEVIEPEIVDRLDRNRVDILETFLVTKSMLELADILKPLRNYSMTFKKYHKRNKKCLGEWVIQGNVISM